MANKKRGEVAVSANGKTYHLRLGVNQICELEEHFGTSISQLGAKFEDEDNIRFGFLRQFSFFVIDWRHAGIEEPTLEMAGDIITDCGISEFFPKLFEAFQAAFPDAEDDESPPAKAG